MKCRLWLVLLLALAANFLVLLAQNMVSLWQWRHCGPLSWLVPEMRYWVSGFVVLLPLVPMTLLKFRCGRLLLSALVVGLAVHAVALLAKAHVPSARRSQHVAACDWAAETIRADYKGPPADVEPFFSWLEYHTLKRPCVEAHSARVAYLLNGRAASLAGCGLCDIPDYLVGEAKRADVSDWRQFARYEKMAERRFGKRDFVIYRRVK